MVPSNTSRRVVLSGGPHVSAANDLGNVQTQSEVTLLLPSTAPASFVPDYNNSINQMSGHVQNASVAMQSHQPNVPTSVDHQQSVPSTNSIEPMSVSPQDVFQSPQEDRSTLLRTLAQPTQTNRPDAVASTVLQSDAVAARPVQSRRADVDVCRARGS